MVLGLVQKQLRTFPWENTAQNADLILDDSLMTLNLHRKPSRGRMERRLWSHACFTHYFHCDDL
jgi:hypothetical protein